MPPVLREMLANEDLDQAARDNLRSLLVREGYSIHARDAAGRSDWSAQQARHLFDHVRLAECHADVMQSERNAAVEQCEQLHAAGVNMASQAQSELGAADQHFGQLREQARLLNSALADSEHRCGSQGSVIAKLREMLVACFFANETSANMSKKAAYATKSYDEVAVQLIDEESKGS